VGLLSMDMMITVSKHINMAIMGYRESKIQQGRDGENMGHRVFVQCKGFYGSVEHIGAQVAQVLRILENRQEGHERSSIGSYFDNFCCLSYLARFLHWLLLFLHLFWIE
jgi:hypothetical protein